MKLMLLCVICLLAACSDQPHFNSKKFQEAFSYCYTNTHHSYMRRDALPTVGECRLYALREMNK